MPSHKSSDTHIFEMELTSVNSSTLASYTGLDTQRRGHGNITMKEYIKGLELLTNQQPFASLYKFYMKPIRILKHGHLALGQLKPYNTRVPLAEVRDVLLKDPSPPYARRQLRPPTPSNPGSRRRKYQPTPGGPFAP